MDRKEEYKTLAVRLYEPHIKTTSGHQDLANFGSAAMHVSLSELTPHVNNV